MAWLHDQQKRERWVRFMETMIPEIDPKAVRLLDEMGFVFRAVYHVGEQSLDESGLSHPQYRVLMHLLFAEQAGERGELNPSEISYRQGVSRNSISSLIRSLEEEGLVERRLDPDDRRRFNISLTDTGRLLVTRHARQHLTAIHHCFDVLDAAEQATLSQLMRKVSAHVVALRQAA